MGIYTWSNKHLLVVYTPASFLHPPDLAPVYRDPKKHVPARHPNAVPIKFLRARNPELHRRPDQSPPLQASRVRVFFVKAFFLLAIKVGGIHIVEGLF